MPLYEYQCDTCGHRFEVIQKFSDAPIAACPNCGGPVHKLLSSPAIQFKGSGFYLTDYGRSTGGKSDSANTKGGKADSGDSKSDGSKSDSAKSDSGKSDSGSSSDSKASSSDSSSAKSTPSKAD